MDVYGIEALLGLPEFRVVNQVIRPTRLDLHLERRDTSIVCPRESMEMLGVDRRRFYNLK